MSFEALKPLIEAGIINESTKDAINEAWESKLNEARGQIRAELREEFSRKYAHDKSVMVDALDKMVSESLSAEIEEFAEEKKALAEDRVSFKRQMMENGSRFQDFMVEKLAEEVKELRSERKIQKESIRKLEQFIMTALAEELQDFEQDKKAVIETKVKLVSEAHKKLSELQNVFIKKSSDLVKESVTKSLKTELTQLKEDIEIARENQFGRRLFEAFASEFAVTHLNENKEIRKLMSIISEKDHRLAEAKQDLSKKNVLLETRNQEIKTIKESAERSKIMSDLMKPLQQAKAEVMKQLLENVQTDRLQSAYEKYLPAVLTNSSHSTKSSVLVENAESRSVITGDKTAKQNAIDTNVIEIKRLAGLK